MAQEIYQQKIQEEATQGEVPIKAPRKNRKIKGRTIVPTTAITLVDSISLKKNKGPNPQQFPPIISRPQSTMSEEKPIYHDNENKLPENENVYDDTIGEIGESKRSVLEKIEKDPKQGDTPKLTEGIVATILVANGDIDSLVQSLSEDPQNAEDEENEEDGDDYIPTSQQIGEERQNALKKQVHFQIALNLFTALRGGKLQTLDKNPVIHVQNFLPASANEEDARKFMLESINLGLTYWNQNVWDYLHAPMQEQELVATCFDLRDPQRRPRYTPEIVKQEILTYFNLL